MMTFCSAYFPIPNTALPNTYYTRQNRVALMGDQ